jgi:hypothetical protein
MTLRAGSLLSALSLALIVAGCASTAGRSTQASLQNENGEAA